MKPPTMNMMQTTRTSNSFSLMKPCATKPIAAAGRKASKTPSTKRAAGQLVNILSASAHSRLK